MTTWIRTADELEHYVASLAGCHALALDTESDSLYHHVEKVCLVQIARAGGAACLVDPLALPGLAPLGPILANPGVVKVLHGAEYDVATLKRDFDFRFAGLFDTMIAARFLGRAEVGLQALLKAELGVEVSKGGQKDDWSRRPLQPHQEAYALADVEHLLVLHERLVQQLTEVGRLAWVREECDAVAALPPARRRNDPDAYQKVKGANQLTPRSLAVMREVHSWREGRAQATNIPPFKIVQNSTLLAMAAKPPRTREELSRIPGMPRLREAEELLDAVTRALALPESELPRLIRTPWPTINAATKNRIAALRAFRELEGKRLGLDISIVLPQKLIDRLAEAAPRELDELAEIDGLRAWRIESYGAQMLKALAL